MVVAARSRFLIPALVALLLLPLGQAPQGPAGVPIAFDFSRPGAAQVEGEIHGACTGWEFALDEIPGDRIHFMASRVTWVEGTIVHNVTRIADRTIRESTEWLPAMTASLDRVVVALMRTESSAWWLDSQQGFDVAWESVAATLGGDTTASRDRTPAPYDLSAGGWWVSPRRVSFDGTATLSGAAHVRVAGDADARAGDGTTRRFEPPPDRTDTWSVGPFTLIMERQPRLQLYIEGLSLLLPHGTWEVGCGDLTARVNGTFAMANVDGAGSADVRDLEFSNASVRLEGWFSLAEAAAAPGHDADALPGEEPPVGPDGVSGKIEGDARRFQIDGALVAVAAGPPPLAVAQITGLALAAGILLLVLQRAGSFVGLLYARLAPERVLNHPRRRKILDAVGRSPGLTLSQAARTFGITINVAKYHVSVLRRSGRLRAMNVGRYVHLWPIGILPTSAGQGAQALLARRPELAFLKELLASGPRPLGDVLRVMQERLGLSRGGARHALECSVAAGLVRRERDSNDRVVVRGDDSDTAHPLSARSPTMEAPGP